MQVSKSHDGIKAYEINPETGLQLVSLPAGTEFEHFEVDTLPEEDFDWLDIWKGICPVLISIEDGEGIFEFYEPGKVTISVKRETQFGDTRITVCVTNNAAIPEQLEAAIQAKFGIEMNHPFWGGDDQGNSILTYRLSHR